MSRSLGRSQDGHVRESEVEEAVRRMVARELHDRVAQTLTGMLVDVENFKTQQVGWDDVLHELDTIQSSTRNVLTSIRQLLHDLRGEDQVGGAFVESLESLVSRFEEKSSVTTSLEVGSGWPKRLAPPASLNLYRIVEEALANVRMHSDARHVRVVLETLPDDQLMLIVEDDGRGVDMDARRPVGLGTVGMKERALFLGGELRIESEPEIGTRVYALVPKEHAVPGPDSIGKKTEVMVSRSMTA